MLDLKSHFSHVDIVDDPINFDLFITEQSGLLNDFSKTDINPILKHYRIDNADYLFFWVDGVRSISRWIWCQVNNESLEPVKSNHKCLATIIPKNIIASDILIFDIKDHCISTIYQIPVDMIPQKYIPEFHYIVPPPTQEQIQRTFTHMKLPRKVLKVD